VSGTSEDWIDGSKSFLSGTPYFASTISNQSRPFHTPELANLAVSCTNMVLDLLLLDTRRFEICTHSLLLALSPASSFCCRLAILACFRIPEYRLILQGCNALSMNMENQIIIDHRSQGIFD
jgi:hypothetical protein